MLSPINIFKEIKTWQWEKKNQKKKIRGEWKIVGEHPKPENYDGEKYFSCTSDRGSKTSPNIIYL